MNRQLTKLSKHQIELLKVWRDAIKEHEAQIASIKRNIEVLIRSPK